MNRNYIWKLIRDFYLDVLNPKSTFNNVDILLIRADATLSSAFHLLLFL